MNVTERKKTLYELHPNGAIYIGTMVELVADNGEVISETRGNRECFEPTVRYQKNDKAAVVIVDTDLSEHSDEKLKQLAALHWTPEIVAMHRAAMQKNLDEILAVQKGKEK